MPARAQKKEIAAARDQVKSGKNLDKAVESMEKLLKDSANRLNRKIWLTEIAALQGQYEQGNEKLYLKQKYDTAQLFSLTRKMYQVMERYDSVESLPDRKGNVRHEYRNRHAEYLSAIRPNLYNGGLYQMARQQYPLAYDFLEDFIKSYESPVFEGFKQSENDSLRATAAYWTVYAGWKTGDADKTIRYRDLAARDSVHAVWLCQYLADTYRQQKDTAAYLRMLEKGFALNPSFPYFFPRLVEYHLARHHADSAMTVVDKALKTDSANQHFLFAKSTVLLDMGRYDETIALCDSLIARNDSLQQAWLNGGLAYFNKAVALDKNRQASKRRRQQLLGYYEKSRSYLERYRALAPDEKERWARPLYTIYLNLNMGKEFDEIDKILRNGNQ